MSMSSDALFFFGVAWAEELQDIEILNRIVNGDEESDAGDDYEMKEWFKEHNIEDVVFDSHCSIDFPMPLLAIKETLVTAYRGAPKQVMISHDHLQDLYRDRIEVTLNTLGIPRDEWPEIGWWTASNWG